VHPELRNRGIGQAMVGEVERYLIDHDHRRVALAVRTDNPAASRLYHRLGYRDWRHGLVVCYTETTLPDGRVVPEPEHCHVLVKDLAPLAVTPRTGTIRTARRP
jgi:ribosomal protein S18 acetylase RimI-like enzyme